IATFRTRIRDAAVVGSTPTAGGGSEVIDRQAGATFMAQATAVDIRNIVLSNSTFGPREIGQLTLTIADEFLQFGQLRDAVAELEPREDRPPAGAVRLGLCQ